MFAFRKSLRLSRQAFLVVRLLVTTGLLAAGGTAALPEVASGAPLQRGDVFLSGSGSVQEFSPTGELQQTVPGTAGASGLCFDRAGRLIPPGVGLFDRSGSPLPSNWPSVPKAMCVVDGFGHVYAGGVGGGLSGSPLSFGYTEYDLQGNVIQTISVPLDSSFGRRFALISGRVASEEQDAGRS